MTHLPIADVLLELADRCEKATGPDREIELSIWRLIDPNAAAVEAEGRTPLEWLHCYTESLDAAMTLVPEGLGWWVQDYLKDGCNATVGKVDSDARGNYFHNCHGAREAATPALALCAAALRARSEHARTKDSSL